MKKKLLLVLIALLFVGVLTGCKKDKTNEVENKTEENNTVVDPAQKEAEDAILKGWKRRISRRRKRGEICQKKEEIHK